LKLTFIDSGVLIAALRGNAELASRAFAILNDPERSFASSGFVKLEVLPKAIFHKQEEEAAFYEAFFQAVGQWVEPNPLLLERAITLGSKNGLSALDALHAAAALSIKAAEIVTTEKKGKPLHRLTSIKVTTIHPDE
jgi:predicted nucleic acid-binding protein